MTPSRREYISATKINFTAKFAGKTYHEEEKKQTYREYSNESQPTNHLDDINLAMNNQENESLDSSSLLKFTRSNNAPEGISAANPINIGMHSSNNRLSSTFIPNSNGIERINKDLNSIRPLSSSLAFN